MNGLSRPLACLLLCACTAAQAADGPRARTEQTEFDFGRTRSSTPIEHEFRISNVGDAPLRITRVGLSPPLQMASMRAQVAPGATATLRVRLDPAQLSGRYDGYVVAYTNDPAAPEIMLSFGGNVVPPLELTPLPAFFLAGVRGQPTEATIDIVNNEPQPVELSRPSHGDSRFTSRLDTVEAGRHYRLSIALKSDAPGGRHLEDITIATSDPAVPTLSIPAHTLLRERVYTFPDTVELGALPLSVVRAQPDMLRQSAQTLMVYQAGGRDFRISATTDVEGLSIRSERGAAGDRHQLTIALDPDRPRGPGSIEGTIVIQTNDPEFPTLRIPVVGSLLADG